MREAGETLFLVRSRGFGPMARLLADRLSGAGAQVAVVCDTRGGSVETTPYDCISMSEDGLAGMGLSGLPPDWAWFCGDLCYYVAAAARPDVDRFALIESDVYVPEVSAAALVGALEEAQVEAIAAGLGAWPEPRRYSQHLERYGLDPTWGCIFPVSCASRRVIAEMQAFRRQQLANGPQDRLNDEAILAGAVLRSGAAHARLEDLLPALVTEATFKTNPPELFETLSEDASERRIFHPVVRFETVLERLRKGEKGYSRHRLRNVLRAAPPAMREAIEAGLETGATTARYPKTRLRRLEELTSALMPHRRLRVMDVGANPLIEGDVSYRMLLDQGQAEVLGFEPLAEAMEVLSDRASPAETYLPHAVGDGQEATLHITRSPGFSSLYRPDPASTRHLGFSEGAAVFETQAVATRRLDDLADVPRPDFLKMDVQGSELAVLTHGRATLSDALVVQIEVRPFPIYDGEPSYGQLEAELTRQGFRFLRFHTLKHVPLSRRRYHKRLKRSEFAQAVDGDAFFVRDLRGVSDWGADALVRLAILGDAVLDSPDLVIFALDHLVQRGAVTADLIERYLELIEPGRKRG